jgi:hypothetical protein
MGQFKKYAQPPASELLDQRAQTGEMMIEGQYEPNGGMLMDPGMGGGFMGGGLPPIDYYGQPKQQWNKEMMDTLIDTQIKVRKDDQGNILPKPKLWLFDTEAFRHFQLSNLRSRDQTEMERDIADIQMLAHQDGNETMCQELQQRVYAKLAMFKSRSDLPIQHRERDAWFTNVSELKTHEIKRPQSSGGFFSDVLGRKKSRDY